MKSTKDHLFASGAAIALILMGLAGCSTIKSVSPFTSSVPYAQDVLPTVARPASPEVPVYKKTAMPPEAVSAAEPAPPPAAAPSPPPPAEAHVAPPVAPPAAPAPAQAAAPTPAPEGNAAPAAAPPASLPPAAAPQTHSSTGAEDGAQAAKEGHGKAADLPPPSIPADRMAFNDNGQYRNLAEVPARPKNLPTFAEARATEASLEADRGGAAPSVDKSTANPAPSARPEDRAPCGRSAGSARPAATLRFDRGSATLPDDQRGLLSDALPDVRNGTGTIRVVGHGDSDAGSTQGTARFDLAMGRASAVAQALAEFGIPVQRIALQVACDENPAAGASVQLYAAS